MKTVLFWIFAAISGLVGLNLLLFAMGMGLGFWYEHPGIGWALFIAVLIIVGIIRHKRGLD
jgi:hypothetical protein